MNRDGVAGGTRSMMSLRVSVSTGRQKNRGETMMDIGDIDILAGIGVVSAAEADRQNADGGELMKRPMKHEHKCMKIPR